MSEQSTETPAPSDQDAPATDAPGEELPADLGDAGKKAIDAMKAERDAARREAKTNADAARRLDEIEQANLSEVEKAATRAAKAEEDLANAYAETSRLRVALKHGLTEDDAALLNDLRDEEAMDRLAGRLAKAASEEDGRVGFAVDSQRRSTSTTPDADATARAFFGI